MKKILILLCLTLYSLPSFAQNTLSAEDIGLSIYKKYAQLDKNKNIFLSPSSLSSAITVTFEGSQGDTRKKAELFINKKAFLNLKKLESSEHIQISVANGIWMDQNSPGISPPTAAHKSLLQKTYGLDIQNESFKVAQILADKINAWVKEKTKSLISQIITPDALKNSNIAIINAIYFKGVWEKPFEKKITSKKTFFSPVHKKTVDMMTQTEHMSYFENSSIQVLELPYKGREVAMTFILPRKISLDALETDLTVSGINSWISALTNARVEVSIPRFKLDWSSQDLSLDLEKLGLPMSGDFTPMGAPQLTLTSVIHKAVIQTNETGTEAAAVTAMMALGSGMPQPPKVFNANRPFLFLIRDTKSGSWIFLGRVTHP